MTESNEKEIAPFEDRLRNEPYRFDFFQAVRIVNLIAQQMSPSELRHAVGGEAMPREEIIRFRAQPSLSFPAGPIDAFYTPDDSTADGETPSRREMIVSFLGLTGPNGVLPRHYTQLVIDRSRHNDFALRDFLDLFNHRLVSLFYRAWEKYRFPIAYESFVRRGKRTEDDLFTHCLYCLVGLGTAGLRRRLDVNDETFLYYGGLFAHFPRNVASLTSLIRDYFQVPADILQFVGQWLYLSEDDQTQMSSAAHTDGLNTQLGTTALVGHRVWSIENRFRVKLGPLGYRQFRRFMPSGDAISPLGQMVRSYVGPDLDFDIQPVLKADEIPQCRLTRDGDQPRLGWNTWLHSGDMAEDAEDAIFVNEGLPVA